MYNICSSYSTVKIPQKSMVSAIRYDKLKLKINSLVQMVMDDIKKSSLICDKPKSRSDVKSPSKKLRMG